MKSFDQAARTYESFGFIQREMADWLAGWIPSDREGTAIEIGAGTGFFTRRLLPWTGNLVATDASPAMVAHGRKHFPETRWEVARADALQPVSAKWIFSSSFLQWADQPVDLLRSWKTVLRPGGRILAGLFIAPTLAELDRVLPGAAPLRWRNAAEWREIARKAGLRIIREEALSRTFLFDSALDLLRALHGVGAAPVRRVSGGRLREAIRKYDQRFASPGGVVSTWTFYRLEAEHGKQ